MGEASRRRLWLKTPDPEHEMRKNKLRALRSEVFENLGNHIVEYADTGTCGFSLVVKVSSPSEAVQGEIWAANSAGAIVPLRATTYKSQGPSSSIPELRGRGCDTLGVVDYEEYDENNFTFFSKRMLDATRVLTAFAESRGAELKSLQSIKLAPHISAAGVPRPQPSIVFYPNSTPEVRAMLAEEWQTDIPQHATAFFSVSHNRMVSSSAYASLAYFHEGRWRPMRRGSMGYITFFIGFVGGDTCGVSGKGFVSRLTLKPFKGPGEVFAIAVWCWKQLKTKDAMRALAAVDKSAAVKFTPTRSASSS
jgi:hypothetical protein